MLMNMQGASSLKKRMVGMETSEDQGAIFWAAGRSQVLKVR